MKTIDIFKDTLREHKLVNKGDKIVIGVSGGPDSLCMLHLFYSIAEEFSLEIIVVHLDHQFRGEASRQDALFVEDTCKEMGIKAYIFSEDVEGYRKKKNISFEEAGREIRYRLFDEIVDKHEADSIAVAQNKNDQAETLMMRLLRGAGVDGLSAIAYKRDNIIRPLLDVDRKLIEAYCEQYGLNARIDKTNLEAIYHRNKIRLELLPYIQDNFNPNIIDTLWRSAKIFQDEKEIITEATDKAIESLDVINEKSGISFNKERFNNLGSGLKRRVARRLIRLAKGSLKDISNINIESVIALIERDRVSSKTNISGSIVAKIDYERVLIIEERTQKSVGEFEMTLNKNGETYVREIGRTIKISSVDKLQENDKNKKDIICVDTDKIKGNLIVRNRRPGDRFTPIGMSGSQKIKDFYINQKIPSGERNSIPLVCDERGIVWIAGYRMDNNYKLDRNTKSVLKITID